MIDVIFDMETADPDDAMTLCLAIHNSNINLRAVTVTPGTNEQIGLVKHILNNSGIDIPIGSYRIGYDKKCVPHFYHNWLGDIKEVSPDDEGYKIISRTLKDYPELTLLTGAPLKNMSSISKDTYLWRWVAQGGFAGDNLVPVEHRLDKFLGKITCPTYNFNGDPTTALNMLGSNNIKKRFLVSKNVCHGVVYDMDMHEQFSYYRNESPAINLMYQGMELYLRKKPQGKKFHDPLALAVAIDPTVCEFREVEMYRKKGEWGANPKVGSNTFISVSVDKEKMVEVLVDKKNTHNKPKLH